MHWLALGMLLSSLATVWALLTIWRRRIDRAQAEREALARTPVQDPFAAALAAGSPARRRARGHPGLATLPPQELTAAFESHVGPVLLAVGAGEDALVTARIGRVAQPRDGWSRRCLTVFGVDAEVGFEAVETVLTVPAASCPTAFERLCVVAALVDLAAAPADTEQVPLAGGVSCFTRGLEHGALPPFGHIVRGPEGPVLRSPNRLSHRRDDDAPRLDFRDRLTPLTAAALGAASGSPPVDVEVELAVRVLGGEVAPIRALATPP